MTLAPLEDYSESGVNLFIDEEEVVTPLDLDESEGSSNGYLIELDQFDEPDASEIETALDEPEAVKELSETNGSLNEETSRYALDPVRMYLDGIAKHKLLTAAQEVQLAKRMEKGSEAKRAKERMETGENIDQTLDRLIAANETAKLDTAGDALEQIIEDGQVAKQQMIEANLRLVVSIAKNYRREGTMEFLDLIQEGTLGLIRAVEKFDYHKGFKFSTYATWWIRQAVGRGLGDKSRTIRLPIHIGEKVSKVVRAKRRLEGELGREPTNKEIADELSEIDMTSESVVELLRYTENLPSLDKEVSDETELGDLITDRNNLSPYEETEISNRKETVAKIVENLPEREREVVRLRFGFEGGKDHTLEEIGKLLGITRERAKQIEKHALAKLKSLPEFKKVPLEQGGVPIRNNRSQGRVLSSEAKSLQDKWDLHETASAVLECMTWGMEQDEKIAKRLGIAESTVKGLRGYIREKLKVSNDEESIAKAEAVIISELE